MRATPSSVPSPGRSNRSGSRFLLLLATLVSVTLAAPASAPAGPSPSERCASGKMKAAGQMAKSALNCHSKSAKKATAVDPACLTKASDRAVGKFLKEESRGGCATVGDAVQVVDDLDAYVGVTVTALESGGGSDADRCSSSKLKAVGKKASSEFKCYSKAAKKAEPVDPDCTDKGAAKLTSAFAKAEGRGGCTTAGDAGSQSTQAEATAMVQAEAIVAICGDDLVGPGEECDGAADGACPGACESSCTCATVCGNNVAEGSEECDGTDDAACPGECLSSCVCPGTCGNGVVEGEEECDDGGNVSGDGCRDDCVLEDTSAICAGVPTTSGTTLDLEQVATGLDQPVHLTAPPLDPSRLFVVEQDGRIRIIKNGTLLSTPFLDIDPLVRCCSERGLLSLAFHPDYESNGLFFVNYTREPDGATVIARYTVSGDPDLADASSGQILMTISQPFSNHNGGQLAFGADDYLYAGMGDGGGGGDPVEAGQDDTTLLAKMLRIDVDVAGSPYHAVPASNPDAGAGLPLGLIWAKGLRNPWRFSFDRDNGDLYIGDVGQNALEEIDYTPGSSTGGENYGWNDMEGSACFDPMSGCLTAGRELPIVEYGRSEGVSVTGGFVYRGCALPDVRGTYFYADFASGFIRSFIQIGGVATSQLDRTSEIGTFGNPSSFGEDARGELYIVNYGGEIYRVVAP